MKVSTLRRFVLVLALAAAATGCKKRESGRGVARPGDPAVADAGGCCGTAPDVGGALAPLGLAAVGLAVIGRRRRR